MVINRTDLDFFKCQVLQNKPSTFVVREDEMYFYCGSDKYLINDNQEGNSSTFPKDITIKGFLTFFNKEGYYVLTFIDITKKHKPIVIKAGDLTKEIA